jgi:pyridoxal biosynthesis lyase PdxS
LEKINPDSSQSNTCNVQDTIKNYPTYEESRKWDTSQKERKSNEFFLEVNVTLEIEDKNFRAGGVAQVADRLLCKLKQTNK